ncbi:TPA: hypothetical protein QEM47_000412 [Pseudomonas putida]|jgi:hypothetical protein|uniref:hypothetical protein n=1 Tax=Pseudomonas putida TaxID=303 RepID=UPI000A3E141C|nr:hypothetical protein [Pseudomonas putida]MDD2116955.1 hypothetical protein [Pseudomonas putida]UPU90696.1 hypothetical protein M0766_17485 [Pseudomonas putida]HDS1727699.1 hypothetical protein [Pseudomonas putida]
MRYEQSAGKLLEALANGAPSGIREISRDPFLGDQINKLYYAYPWFLLECLDKQLRAKLYLPWEDPERFEPLRLHLAITHHWRLEEVRLLKDDELLDLLRPELMALQLESADVQNILERLDDLVAQPIHQDLQGRIRTE